MKTRAGAGSGLRIEVPLSEDELRAVEEGIAGHEKLVAKLTSCPTPNSS